MPACHSCRFYRVARQKLQEFRDAFGIEARRGRQLPEERSGLLAECQDAAAVEIAECSRGAPELQVVRDEATALDGEREPRGRRLGGPAPEHRRGFQAVERAVQLD